MPSAALDTNRGCRLSSRPQIRDRNTMLIGQTAQQRIDWALQCLPHNPVMTSSFGAQSAVLLHMMNLAWPNIPVIILDTGHLFPETYQFIDQLVDRLELNLQVYSATQSAAWQRARYGELWKQGKQGLEQYNRLNKIEPLQRALQELGAGTWFSGARRTQSEYRAKLNVLEKTQAEDYWKVYPLIDWNDKQIHDYLKQNDLPYHPLRDKGYLSIGDVHSTKSLSEVSSLDELRFQGLTRECGIHQW